MTIIHIFILYNYFHKYAKKPNLSSLAVLGYEVGYMMDCLVKNHLTQSELVQ